MLQRCCQRLTTDDVHHQVSASSLYAGCGIRFSGSNVPAAAAFAAAALARTYGSYFSRQFSCFACQCQPYDARHIFANQCLAAFTHEQVCRRA